MALDSGSKEAAQRHMTRAGRLAAASGDTQLTAQSYASLSHVARLRGNGAEALAHAETGYDTSGAAHHMGHLRLGCSSCVRVAWRHREIRPGPSR
ncbi:hypothetical protein [Micromonospora sp. HM5-17]|jgi:hypothetical protein|uniref:hypothetical protein n=1 Tax=Micromonospora sp. HM5-17 TaxID=2487710 RepID=UPI0011CE3DC6|nr:hypothetical protein [Micromonospora sp. HM5-17]